MRYLKSLAITLISGIAALSAPVLAQDWDPTAREFDRDPTSPRQSDRSPAASPQRSATLEQLNKILSAPQLPAGDRLMYLNLRAFHYTRLNREADAQKDIAAMEKLLPEAWSVLFARNTILLAGNGDRATALRLLDYGLVHKPGNSAMIVGQADIHMQLAEHARAIGLLDNAIAGAPTTADRQDALLMRGIANFNVGNFVQSHDDFESTLATRTTLKERLHPTLWRYAAQVRARRDARGPLSRAIGAESLSEWPGPIARFLLGKITAGELDVIAESDDAAKKANGKCLAAFYIGIDSVRRGDRQQAREKFQLTQARCSTLSRYNWAAASELKRL